MTGNSSGLCGGSVTPNAPGTAATVVAPNAADCTGGTIQGTLHNAVSLVSTQNTSLTRMNIKNSKDSGIFGDALTNFTLTSSWLENNGDTPNVNEGGLSFANLLGTNAVTNSAVNNSFSDNIVLVPTSGTLTDLVFSGVQATQVHTTTGAPPASPSILLPAPVRCRPSM